MKGEQRRILMSWAALALASLAWFGSQQIGSDISFARCHSNGPIVTGLIGLAALALTALGGALSWRILSARGEPEARTFPALVGLMAAALLALAIVWQTVAAFLIPDCFG